jgi:RimJ/RimL family protein N-acetyltransferase
VSETSPFAQPVGEPVDATPAGRPGPVTLQGRFGRLEKLNVSHAPALWEVVKGHDHIWTYMPSYGPFSDPSAFGAWVAARARTEDPYAYAVVDPAGQPLGTLSLMAIRPEHRVIEVGHVLYAPALQRTPLATEAQYLAACYVFETLGYRRYEWKTDTLNASSRRAALRYGFNFEGIFRQHMIGKGRNRDTAWYAMLDEAWPARKAAFQRWLAAENFGPDGHQKCSLAALNGVESAKKAVARV